ncbi:hypothetical protein RB195_018561 [Necator americanus]|uniref:Mos1 transposase HTH domain-containing protein n=1 Tax=Necator americanus TaxID=51031 RepID=A0ABR1CBP6_NECAM
MSDRKWLYDFKQSKTAAHCHRSLSLVFGQDVISRSQCRRWFQRFANGNESLGDEEYDSPPVVVDNQGLLAGIEEDSTQTVRSLAEHFRCSKDQKIEYFDAVKIWVDNFSTATASIPCVGDGRVSLIIVDNILLNKLAPVITCNI